MGLRVEINVFIPIPGASRSAPTEEQPCSGSLRLELRARQYPKADTDALRSPGEGRGDEVH